MLFLSRVALHAPLSCGSPCRRSLCGVCWLFLVLCFLCGAGPCGLWIVQRHAAVFFRGCPARSTARAWSDSRRTSPGTAVESYVFQHWFSVTLEATPGTVAENLVSLDRCTVLPGVAHGSSRETYPKRLRYSHIRKGKLSRIVWIFVFFLWRIWQRGHDSCKALVCHRGLRFPGILLSWWLRPLSTWLTVSRLRETGVHARSTTRRCSTLLFFLLRTEFLLAY